MSQLSFFSAESTPPDAADLAGLLAAQGQPVIVSGRTRISVVNLSGLASDMAREDFVNRLQMALFGWIKRHPSPRGLLYVMDEAQIFLPSGKEVASLSSGIRLAAQARKYGLGLVVATQVPKGIHNQIVSNCTTQVFGRQSAPVTIAAARDMVAKSKARSTTGSSRRSRPEAPSEAPPCMADSRPASSTFTVAMAGSAAWARTAAGAARRAPARRTGRGLRVMAGLQTGRTYQRRGG